MKLQKLILENSNKVALLDRLKKIVDRIVVEYSQEQDEDALESDLNLIKRVVDSIEKQKSIEPTKQKLQLPVSPPREEQSVDKFAENIKRSLVIFRNKLSKVFIIDAFKINNQGLSLEQYKNMLLKAHKEGKIALSRADLTNVLDPTKVEQSLIRDPAGADYHFIRV